MSARDTLTPELRAEVLRLEDDLRARVASLPDVQSAWREEYDGARAAERTAAAWEVWVDERVTLAAVAWVLTTVFVRFCEDNALVKPVWISGPRSREAIEAQQQFLRETARTNADVTDREWLLQAVEHLKSLPATAGLVDDTSPMWLVTPSGDAATRLLNFWRERDESGALMRELSDPDLDTRFLGDLYQDISEDAKKRYALLQTPVFVEEFILDRTLEPALNERPLEGFKMIDPTCGSGHFLLGGFQRLLDRWHKHAPGLDERERVQAALDSVYGVDINPFAVAIARFRLTVAALQACGLKSLEEAPAFKYHLAAGDSLLHGLDQQEFDLGAELSADRVAARFAYETENLSLLQTILRSGQYDAVVGNPPYITVKDAALSKLYRERYSSCHRQYALTVPFMERFFSLAKGGAVPGWAGQITGNSFMKREFGTVLIERFLPTKDLQLVVDASGAYIPGHGTPTAIIVGRNVRPAVSTVRTVLGIKAEPGIPADPAAGIVWSDIVAHIDDVGWSDDWISVVDTERSRLATHPWVLSGGGAVALMEAIESAGTRRLGDFAVEFGRTTVVGEDDAWLTTPGIAKRLGLEGQIYPFVVGENVRDFNILQHQWIWWPYEDIQEPRWVAPDSAIPMRALWRNRMILRDRTVFGKSFTDRGRPWYDHLETYPTKLRTPLSIALAEVSTHNHFVLDRGGKTFKQSSPVIKLHSGSSIDDYQALLGVLNSSLTCFWLRQVCGAKGGSGIGRGIQPEAWMERYNFNPTNVLEFPLVPSLPSTRGRQLDELAHEFAASTPNAIVGGAVPTRDLLNRGRQTFSSTRAQMVAQQEELDWEVYERYGILEEDLTYAGADLPRLNLGERAFEIVLARRVAAGVETTAWFERHGSSPITDLPIGWPESYKTLVERRIALIETSPQVRLLERPEYKRRWAEEEWESREERALRNWLLDRLEARPFWHDQQGRPTPTSVAVLADAVARDPELVSVLVLWEGRPDPNLVQSLERLLMPEAVPFLAALRLKDSGLRKHEAWTAAWKLQRLEDANAYRALPRDLGGDGRIPIPPRYASADFQRLEYWSLRGKLDLPNERFISYPVAGREGDTTSVLGWAGWDHAQQALALATLIQSGEQQGWSEDRLIPLAAGLAELLPWVEQWHSEPDALYGGSSPAEFFSGLLDSYMAKLGATRELLAAWRPPAPTRGRKAKT